MSSHAWTRLFAEALRRSGGRLEESMAPPEYGAPPPEILSAKVLARRRSASVHVKEDFIAKVSGVRNLTTRVFRGDRGKIIGDDGNNFVLMLASAGRVQVSREEFDRFFERVPDPALAFTDPEPNELMI